MHHLQGKFINDPQVLLEAARQAGVEGAEEYLKSDAGRSEVRCRSTAAGWHTLLAWLLEKVWWAQLACVDATRGLDKAGQPPVDAACQLPRVATAMGGQGCHVWFSSVSASIPVEFLCMPSAGLARDSGASTWDHRRPQLHHQWPVCAFRCPGGFWLLSAGTLAFVAVWDSVWFLSTNGRGQSGCRSQTLLPQSLSASRLAICVKSEYEVRGLAEHRWQQHTSTVAQVYRRQRNQSLVVVRDGQIQLYWDLRGKVATPQTNSQ